MTEEKKPKTRPSALLGVNQLRMLVALREGPLLGLFEGPRPAVKFINTKIEWLPRTLKGKYSANKNSMRSRTQVAMHALVAHGYVEVKKTRIKGTGGWRSDFYLTRAGDKEFTKQSDPDYVHKLRQRRYQKRAALMATYLSYRTIPDAELPGIDRHVATRNGWRVLVRRHPIDGWQFRLIRPDGLVTDWVKSDDQQLNKAKRQAEKTFRIYAKAYDETMKENSK